MKETSHQLFLILLERLVKTGLPLVSPHPRLIWQQRKTGIVKKQKLDLSGFRILCDFSGSAFGFIRCKDPEQIDLNRFKALIEKHQISEKEREKWWPETKSFFFYPIRDFFAFETSRRIKKAAQNGQVSIQEIIFKREEFDPRVTAKELKRLSNKALISLHGQVHTFWEERGGRRSDELVINAHLLIIGEMKRRGLEHRIQDELDEITLEKMGLRINEDWVYIDDLEKILGSGFSLKDPFLAVIGSVAVSGRGKDLDIWVNFPTGKNAVEKFWGDLEFRIRSYLNENLNKKIHLVPDPEGKFTNFMPLARLRVEFLKPEERKVVPMSKTQIEPGTPFAPLKAKTGYGKFEYFDKEALWKGWIQKYMVNSVTPLVAEPKVDGIRITGHRWAGKVALFTEDKERDRAEFIPEVAKEIKGLNCESCILDGEMVIYEGGAPIPRHEMIKLVVSKTPITGDIRYFVFDLLWLNGKSLIDAPLKDRISALNKILPKDKTHLKRLPAYTIRNRREFDNAIAKCSAFPGSEGAMLKSLEGKYDLTGRTGEWAKLKLAFELKTAIIGIYLKPKPFPKGQIPTSDLTNQAAVSAFKRLQKDSKTYILRCAYRGKTGKLEAIYSDHKLTPGDLELKWNVSKKKWQGTEDPRIWQMARGFPPGTRGEYAYGNTYGKKLEPGPKMGDIVTIRPIMVRKFVANGKTMFAWMFPNLREIDPERHAPDTIDDMERIVRESAARTPGKKTQMQIMEAIHHLG